MSDIKILDSNTIDKIAAGEVVERPMSVVKELIENAIDADAGAITVEIKNGGIDYIRITDNGCGIEKSQVKSAFLRHATSKIRAIEDLLMIKSLGFRGEALSSICAIARVELLTKTKEELTGTRYCIEGGREMVLEDVGIPNGTTFIVRNIFYNTPARRKFLKTGVTEGNYITELIERMMLSHPEIAFKYIVNGNVKLQSFGNGDLKEVIYQIYGRDFVKSLLEVTIEEDDFSMKGFVSKPELARSTRAFEVYFVNHRYIKSKLIQRALDEAYSHYLMLHKYPVVFLNLQIRSEDIDVNVHPTKMEIKFLKEELLYERLVKEIVQVLSHKELIPEALEKKEFKQSQVIAKKDIIPEPFEQNRMTEHLKAQKPEKTPEKNPENLEPVLKEETVYQSLKEAVSEKTAEYEQSFQPKQLKLFEHQFLTEENVKKHRIIGQLFQTYWLVEYEDKLYVIDQHAAHEKVMYERFMKQLQNKEVTSQYLAPPVIVTLSAAEEGLITSYMDTFRSLGFEIEHFGGNEYTLRQVPTELYGLSEKQYFIEFLDELFKERLSNVPEVIQQRIATMACKSAVKGNNRLSYAEADELIKELLSLDNPYNCPHGRPTIVSYSKYEIEKSFKRIIS